VSEYIPSLPTVTFDTSDFDKFLGAIVVHEETYYGAAKLTRFWRLGKWIFKSWEVHSIRHPEVGIQRLLPKEDKERVLEVEC